MEKKHLQNNILSARYSREVWYDVLKKIFGVRNILSPARPIPLVDNDIAKEAVELGNFYTADERLVGIYEITLKADARTKLTINKVGLRNLLRTVYKYDVDGALIVFVQNQKWRFSYVSEIRTEEGKKETEPKRYTYLFGAGESCRTAADRFSKLTGKPFFLDDLYDAFSVEKLNEDFFKSYRTLFENFSDHLAKERKYRKLLLGSITELENGWKNDNAKPIRDFSKKLLGRIIFLQFLQKKGWMGVPATKKDWLGGNVKFLQSLFNEYEKKETFHSTVLKKLFFETLNTKRKNDIAPFLLGKDIKIPYLNGGLFDKDVSFENDIDFPVHYFKDLFDFLEQYNFTIDENDPYDSEVGIDPEMLGHIFENLLEENREKGAFYTPKEIVHFMCQESLIEYLGTQMPNENRGSIELLVRNNKVSDELSNYKKAQLFNEKLKSVRICDPAIGSGAFPMGLLREIFECRRLLYGYLKTNEPFDPAIVKKEIIQNNIYGVDIENGAVEIARLRFWLALVVDELTPQPLPNLDYKIMQGDSLLESFAGIDLKNLARVDTEEAILSTKHGQLELGTEFSSKKQALLVFDEQSKEKLYDLINDYYSYDESISDKYHSKNDIRRQINEIVEGKLLSKFSSQKHKIEKQLRDKSLLLSPNIINSSDTKGIAQKKEKNAIKLNKEIEQLQKEEQKLADLIEHLHELQLSTNKPYFLWHLWFRNVFDEGGFDIVIGNPPYIQLENNNGLLAKLYKSEKYEFLENQNKGDIYCLFYEKGNHLLKNNGSLCYITSNKWMRAEYGEPLREFFSQKTNPVLLIDFAGQRVFKSATVDVNILMFKKEKNQQKTMSCLIREDVLNNLSVFVRQQGIINEYFGAKSWVILSDIEKRIKEKIERIGVPLKEWDIQINYGIKTGLNEAFIIDGKKRKQLIEQDPKSEEIIRPILRGRDIKRYSYDFPDLWLINTHNGLKEKGIKPIQIEDYPAIQGHLHQFYNELEKRADKGDTPYNLRNCAYMEDFYRQKLVWAETMRIHKNTEGRFPRFGLDMSGDFITDKTCFFAIGKDIKFLVAFLNSLLGKYLCSQYVSILDDGGYLMQKVYLEKIPIPRPSLELINLVDKILDLGNSEKWEIQINEKVFQLYDFSIEEIKFIESQ